jgi:ribose transport system ATP-binding protein
VSVARLEVRGVEMAFEGRPVLRDVGLVFEPGRIHGIVGHNGSGKSTLLRILGGFYRPLGGEVRLGDVRLPLGSPHRSYRAGLRFVHQELGLVPQFDALENFGIGGEYDRTRWRTIDWARQRARCAAALDQLGYELPLDGRPVASLRAVDRAVLAIARAIAPASDGTGARYLMLDEPTTALEETETERLFEVVRRLAASGVGVLFVSHQLDEVLGLCDVVTVLRDGRVVETVPSRGATREQLVRAMLGDTLERLAAGLHADGERVSSGGAELGSDGRRDVVLSVRGLRSATLRGVDLDVARGECVCVVGLSGSGREELVYALAGAVPSSAQRVVVAGEQVARMSPAECRRRRVALVPGNRLPGSMVAEFTIQENVTFSSLEKVARLGGLIDRTLEQRRARQWIDAFGIRPADPRYPAKHLSGGNKQKVILARWLSIGPVAMLVDEPTAGVDVGAVAAVLETLHRVAGEGTALLITTSEVGDVIDVTDRVVVLNRGRVVAELRRGDRRWSEAGLLELMSGADAGAA